MRTLAIGTLGLVLLCAGGAAAQTDRLSLTLQNGHVTIDAHQVSAREILQEWARVGDVRTVNLDRLPTAPLTLHLTDVPEAKALQIVLRAAPGYLAAPRAATGATASVFDRILIMPTSAMASAQPVAAGPPTKSAFPVQQPAPADPAFMVPNDQPAPDGVPEPPQVFLPGGMANGGSNAVFNSGGDRPPETNFDYANPQQYFQNNQVPDPSEAATAPPPTFFPNSYQQGQPPIQTGPTAVPSAGQTTSRPGEMVQPPPQPFQNPYGIPGNVQPGSVQPPPNLEPDRSKYLNPYQPVRPPPLD